MRRALGSIILLAGSLWIAPAMFAQDVPSDYGIDLQLGLSGRPSMMAGSPEMTGTAFNDVGNDVFGKLIETGFNVPYPWKLTLVGNQVINAGSTAGGQVYVYGGMLSLIGQNKGLWAAVLSHEVSHTGLRHQVRIYVLQLYNERMIQYYQLRARYGDKSANWALIGFRVGAALGLKKLEREQEHQADSQGMLLMARAGYHPDYVFALHHLLRAATGEQSKFAAFFSSHPRWETRDQRDDRAYADSLMEYNRLWPDPDVSPGRKPPLVAFVGKPSSQENKQSKTADLTLPIYCRNASAPLQFLINFRKDKRPVQALAKQRRNDRGELVFRQDFECSEKTEATPIIVRLPATLVSKDERKVEALVHVYSADGVFLEEYKPFHVHFPKP